MLPPRIHKEVVRSAMGEYADTTRSEAERGEVYKELLGFVPPRIEARFAVTGAIVEIAPRQPPAATLAPQARPQAPAVRSPPSWWSRAQRQLMQRY